MKAPAVMDLNSLQRLSDMVKGADLHKIHSELLNCLPPLPKMPGFHKLKDELRTSFPSMDFLSSLSDWHIVQLLTKCLPDRFPQVFLFFSSSSFSFFPLNIVLSGRLKE
jgi:adiponectin receptor